MNETQLQSSTRRELLALAAKGRVRGRHRMSKAQLIEAIRSRSPAPTSQPERYPSRRSEKKGPSQGEWKLSFAPNNKTARPEERPSSGRVSKGARRTRSTASAPHEVEPEVQELTELPSSYGQTRLTLMGIDPFWVHAYWEVTPHDREAVMAQLGSERASAHWVLRFYDVTCIDFDGSNAHSSFDQPVDLAANNWYVNLWSSEKTYCADIGARVPSGRFAAACRSNFVQTPRADESPHYRPEWLRVEGGFDTVERATVPPQGESRVSAAEFHVPAETTPLAIPAHERAPHAPVAETDVRKYYGAFFSLARAAGEQTVPARGNPAGAFAETRLGAAWHEVRGRPPLPLGSSGSGGWASSGQTAVHFKSSVEDDVVPRSASFETAPERTAPPQDERGMIGSGARPGMPAGK
jgi:hypothetical protein